MNNIIRLLILFLLPGSTLWAQSDWELKKNKNDISISTRESDLSLIKEYRVSSIINHPLPDVYKFLTDLEQRPEWVINCLGLTIIDSSQDGKIYYHTSYDIPWPMADRDLVVVAQFNFTADGEGAHLLTTQADYDYPPQDGLIRMPLYREEVFLSMINEKSTLFRAEGFVDPGGSVPAWIVNMFLVNGIYDSVIRTRERVAELVLEKVP